VGLVDGFGLGRSALAKEHRQHDDGSDGEELALPVLEGLEPELGGAHELPRADAGGAVLVLFGAVLMGTGDGVSDERGDEQHAEGDEQAAFIEIQPDAATPYRPRRIWVVAVPARGLRREDHRALSSTRQSRAG
jgi:hypothetical protein